MAKGNEGTPTAVKEKPAAVGNRKVNKAAGALLGVDYGRVRIGLAIADMESGLPRPLLTLNRVNRNEDMRRLRELIREHGIRRIVVGLPLRLDGAHGEMAEEATRFATRLRKQFGLPVDMLDERLTSWEAERLLEEQSGRILHDTKSRRSGGRDARASVDAVAAAVILKEYLQLRSAAQSGPNLI